METFENEQWSAIENHNDYEVSNYGRVRSWKTYSGKRGRESRILKPKGLRNRRYLAVCLSMGKRSVTKEIHRLVAEAFHGPCPDGYMARHLDGDSHNNKASNLAWGTYSENQMDRHLHGTMYTKLTDAEVLIIREMYQMGGKAKALAERFNVSSSYVHQIGKGARSEGVETPWIVQDALARGLGKQSVKNTPVIIPREPRLEGPWKNPQVA